jgi:hypothetical protein
MCMDAYIVVGIIVTVVRLLLHKDYSFWGIVKDVVLGQCWLFLMLYRIIE